MTILLRHGLYKIIDEELLYIDQNQNDIVQKATNNMKTIAQ